VTWSADGKSLFVHRHDGKTVNVFRVDVETGRRDPLMSLTSPDPTGVTTPPEPLFSADGKSCVYQYSRTTNDLYLVEGLR
jgi:Tol biopolymer transport system component